MGIAIADIRDLVSRFGNSTVIEQANLECPFYGERIIKRETKKKQGVVNIKAGPLTSVKFVRDYGTLPRGNSKKPVQGKYDPVGILGRIEIPRIAAKTAVSEEDGISIVKEQMDTCGKTMGLTIGSSIFGAAMGSPAVQVLAGATTFQIADPSKWRVGMAFEVWDPAGPTAIEGDDEDSILEVQNLAIPADGVGNTTVTLVAATVMQWETTYKFYIRGTQDAADSKMVDFQDITNNAINVYGVAANTNDWNSTVDSTTGPLLVERLAANMVTYKRRRKKKPRWILANSRNEQRYNSQQNPNIRYQSGKRDAQSDQQVTEYQGVSWYIDELIEDTDVYFFNDEDVMIHEWQEPQVEADGEESVGMGRGAMRVSDDRMIYDVQVLGIMAIRCLQRNGLLRITNITD